MGFLTENDIVLQINGEEYKTTVPTSTTLLDALREILKLTVRLLYFSKNLFSMVSMLNMDKGNNPEEIRDLMSGNLCRCGAYANIFKVAELMVAEEEKDMNDFNYSRLESIEHSVENLSVRKIIQCQLRGVPIYWT
ncbi:unnamed protein product [Bathycoccus prasinos]